MPSYKDDFFGNLIWMLPINVSIYQALQYKRVLLFLIAYYWWHSALPSVVLPAHPCGNSSIETLISRLNHCSTILPTMHHFLGRLWQAIFQSKISNWTCLSPSEMLDLHLLSSFLDYAHAGISLNTVVYRKPINIDRSDASEFGLGGYNLISGKAWRFELPIDCCLRSSLNSIEFLACLITRWIDVLSDKLTTNLVFLVKLTALLLWVGCANQILLT
jgi:hypothetical protein